MKQFKLKVHSRDFSSEDLVLNPKDFNEIKVNDVLEIYHQVEEFSRLLLQVSEPSFRDDLQQNTISVDQTIAANFRLRKYDEVIVDIVDPVAVALDSLELTFKDQYLERGDMWRIKQKLENTCVYLDKKVEFWSTRLNVYEMWSQGERVACGVITENTKIVFRSCTNLIYLFLQMSSEMWDMDINGDLYFEKAINGFLSDLFAKWKENDSSHEVTIVLFSRTFYEAQSIDEFPDYMHSCLHKDYKGRYYEDFYRVVVQNERYDDWSEILVYLKKIFNSYRETVVQFHNRPGFIIPKAINSTAAQGNFLEVLNMSLNVFEKHYQDRSFDRTGHLSVVITPGVGVFEVDRELTNITKQRIIDNGVGSDLVCLGEQPLHAVPLFKFHSKNNLNTADDYSMPHWTNLSFYSSSKHAKNSSFIPRIKLPQKKNKTVKEKHKATDILPVRSDNGVKDEFPNLQSVDYDEYDAQVFKHAASNINITRDSNSLQRTVFRKKTDSIHIHSHSRPMSHHRKFSEADISQIHNMDSSKCLSRSAAVSIPRRQIEYSPLSSSLGLFNTDERLTPASAFESYEEDNSPPIRAIVGSAGSPYDFLHSRTTSVRPSKALINPFDPSHVTIKLTSNRRRWTHVFPLGPTGIFMQQHHYQAIPNTPGNSEDIENLKPTQKVLHAGQLAVEARRRKTSSMSIHPNEVSSRSKGTSSRGLMLSTELPTEKSLTLIWGATGEQEWTPALTTGVDWKSCTIPACLPLTTDYFPDRRSIQNDFVVSDYDLIPEYMNCDASNRNNVREPLKTEEVFRELVCQRLQQGFQLIVNPNTCKFGVGRATHSTPSVSSPLQPFLRPVPQADDPKEEYFLSIGRIFHKLTLVGGTITVTILKPRHPYPTINIKYLYRFMALHSQTYEISAVDFNTEKLENFNWNYLDHYICSRGEGDFTLTESLKYSKFRMFLLPLTSLGTKRIQDGSQYCDVYDELSQEEEAELAGNFLQFVCVLNKIRKPHILKKANRDRAATIGRPSASTRRGSNTVQSCIPPSVGGYSNPGIPPVYRDRLDSNRLGEKPRPRTGTKPMERMRSESGNGGRANITTSEISESKLMSTSNVSLDTATDNMLAHKDGSEESTSPSSTPRRLTRSASMNDIVEAMKHPQDGLCFLTKTSDCHTRLPNMSFISAEATAWVMDHVEGYGAMERACSLLQTMLNEDFICHCSGNPSYPFIHGYYLYHICPTDKELSDGFHALGDTETFQREWFEVAFHTINDSTNKHGPSFLQPDLPWSKREDGVHENGSIPLYKNTNIEIPVTKSERKEWGHVKYHGKYTPSAASELVLQWLVATGSFVTELVLKNWARRANSIGLLLVPVHSDPFAQPFSNQFDPLRRPIFIPLAVQCMSDDKSHPFSVFPSETWDYRMFLFQEAIIRRFGFLPCQYSHFAFDPQWNNNRHHQYQPQYVHTTGNAMLMIPIKLREIINRRLLNETNRTKHLSTNFDTNIVSSPHEEYITRHVTGQVSRKTLQPQTDDSRVGFFWSWNSTLSKRWKSYSTGDDQFMFKILNDFRLFCANGDQRLRKFWEGCKEEVMNAAIQADRGFLNYADEKI